MTKFSERLEKNLNEWFERKKVLTKDDYEMIRSFTYKTEHVK